MPVTWKLRAETHVVEFVWREPCTFGEWQGAMLEIFAHPAYVPGCRFLVDRREVGPPSTAFVTSMAHFFDLHREQMEGVRAAVVVRDEVGFGMARMTELFATGRNPTMTIRAFWDPAEAERWLLAP